MGNRNFQRIYKVASNSTSGSEGKYMIQELVGEDDAHSVLFFNTAKRELGLDSTAIYSLGYNRNSVERA